MPRASLDKDPHDVATMFDGVARRYDLTNDVLSLGQDRMWRRATLKALDALPGETVLDLAAGTGTSSQPFADAGAVVVPCDFSQGMLAVGKAARPGDDPRVVRLDRYGFMVRLGNRLARLSFPRPVTDRHDLAHLLHPVLCHRCVHHEEAA